MTSEFVDGSAWMKPPVDGPAEALIGAAAADDRALAVPAAPAGLAGWGVVVAPPALDEVAPPELNAARSTVASLVASAFFRCTTQTLPVVADPCGGRSSLAISERTAAILLGLALRTISELLRVSTRIDGAAVPRFCPPGTPTAVVGPLSLSRCSSGWISAATA